MAHGMQNMWDPLSSDVPVPAANGGAVAPPASGNQTFCLTQELSALMASGHAATPGGYPTASKGEPSASADSVGDEVAKLLEDVNVLPAKLLPGAEEEEDTLPASVQQLVDEVATLPADDLGKVSVSIKETEAGPQDDTCPASPGTLLAAVRMHDDGTLAPSSMQFFDEAEQGIEETFDAEPQARQVAGKVNLTQAFQRPAATFSTNAARKEESGIGVDGLADLSDGSD